MLLTKPYNRERARRYAERWAFSRNPLFADYTGIGGNCTNFVSQCLYAGGCRMNFTPVFGWYYLDKNDRTASFTGVNYLYNFLISNEGEGPYGRESDAAETETGDIIQLSREGDGYFHSVLAVGREGEEIFVAAQSENAYMRPLSSYRYDEIRYLHIEGVRILLGENGDCFSSLLAGEELFIRGSGTALPGNGTPPAEGGTPPGNGTPPTEGTAPPGNGTPPTEGTAPPGDETPPTEGTAPPGNGTPPTG